MEELRAHPRCACSLCFAHTHLNSIRSQLNLNYEEMK